MYLPGGYKQPNTVSISPDKLGFSGGGSLILQISLIKILILCDADRHLRK
jgi:hypothetical protein